MKLFELFDTHLHEEPVMSSWISDLTLVDGPAGDVTMALGNGRRYSVRGLGPDLYTAWAKSPSKGKFWHQSIKNSYVVSRLI